MPLSKLEPLKRDAEEVRFLERQGRYPEAHKMLWDMLYNNTRISKPKPKNGETSR